MKKISKLLLTIALCMSSLFAFSSISVKADDQEPVTYEYSWSDRQVDGKVGNKNKFIMDVTITINETANEYVEIDLSDIHSKYLELRKAKGITNTTSVMPGDSIPAHITIVNNSSKAYSYQNGSIFVAAGVNDIGRIPANDAIIQLVDTNANKQIELEELLNLYTKLSEKGYENDGTALERYLVAYANEAYNTNVNSALELVQNHRDIAGEVLAGNKIATNYLSFEMSLEEANAYVDSSDFFAKSAKLVKFLDNAKSRAEFQFVLPEEKLAAASSTLFYGTYYNIGFGSGLMMVDEATSNASKMQNTSTKKYHMSLYDYTLNTNGLYDATNNTFNSLVGVDAWNNNECVFDMGINIDANTGNGYTNYKLSYQAKFMLERVITSGDLTVTKTINYEPYETSDNPFFIFKATNVDTGDAYYKVLALNDLKTTGNVVFEDLPLGTYTVHEFNPIRYSREEDKTVTITRDNPVENIEFYNNKTKDNDFSDSDMVINSFTKNEDNVVTITQQKVTVTETE